MLKQRALACVFLLLGASGPLLAAAGFVKKGAMGTGRASFPAVRLADGNVLVASDGTLERYDPANGSFSPAGNLTVNRGSGLTMTLLHNGTVLLAGGESFSGTQDSAEIFDPAAGTSTPTTGSMSSPRSFHAATLLASGTVLITGGHQSNHLGSALATAEIYDPVTRSFSPVPGSMNAARQDHTATQLANGRVLVIGGFNDTSVGLSSAEVFDPGTGSFGLTNSLLNEGRGNHTSNLLASGQVVVIGGFSVFAGSSLVSAEVYDPQTDQFSPAGAMMVPRGAHTATELQDGKLLVVGGFDAYPFLGSTLASAEIYDPVAGGFTPTAGMHQARGRHAAAALVSGEVLVAGGQGQCCGGGLSSAEVFSLSVVDTAPPIVTVPFDITVPQAIPEGAVVVFASGVSASDDVDAAPIVSCEPASGSTFPVGTNTVTCTATDSSGNEGQASFKVTVVEALDIEITIDATAIVHPVTGLATLSGRVSCNRETQRGITVDLSQGSGRNAVHASATRGFTCVPPSLVWIVSVSATEGRFRAGKASASASGDFCDQFGCDQDSVTATIRLTSGEAGGGEFPIERVVDTATRMPGSQSNFGSLGLPFVGKGVVAFQGYGPTLSESGLYSSSGDRVRVVADTRTRIPGGTGRFTAFDSPAFDGVTLAFQGHDASSGVGLYTSRGGLLAKVANGQTPVPGGAGSFGGFVGPVLSGSKLAFRGSSEQSAFGTFGVYSGNAEGLRLIADRQTPVPAGNGNFAFFGARPVIDRGTVVFPASGSDPADSGIYSSRDGVLTTLADLGTPVPGGSGNFRFFGTPAIGGGAVAFTGFDDMFRAGIYRSATGSLARVVDTQTTVPGRSVSFASFGNPVVADGRVAFSALASDFVTAGIYAGDGGALVTIADFATPVPGGQGFFRFVGPGPVPGGEGVAFLGVDTTGTQGIYVRTKGTLHKVISATDTLDGRAISLLQLATGDSCDFFGCLAGSGKGFDGDQLAFHVTFADGSGATQGIYVADVSRPLVRHDRPDEQ